MGTLRNVSVALSAGLVITGAACSGSLDGYDTGSSSSSGTSSNTTGHGGGTASGSTTSTGGAISGPTPASATQASATSTSTGTTSCPTMCGSTCVDTTTDAQNCGACGHACAASYPCIDSVCGNVVVDASTLLATCAVLKAGEVWCWGRDVYGEIGVPPASAGSSCYQGDSCRAVPAKVTGISNAVQVVAGRQATCAITGDGAVYCWGSNEAGLLGHTPGTGPDTTCAAGIPCTPTPTPVVFSTPVKAVQLTMGTVNACVRTDKHDVWCWGLNNSGQIKSPPSTGPVGAPVQNANVIENADDVAVSSDISAKANAVCVRRTTSHEVDCWGASGDTLFPATSNPAVCSAGGDNYCTPHATPVPMVFTSPAGALLTADAISLGASVGVALQGTKVLVWGSNYYAQGANSSQASHFDVKQILGSTPVSGVSAQGLTTLLLGTDGTVWALGWSDNGAIGNGVHGLASGTCPNPNTTQGCQITPVQIAPAALSGVTKVVSGLFGSAAITSGGKLYAWGANYAASLGHAPSTMGDVNCGSPTTPLACADVPVLVPGLP